MCMGYLITPTSGAAFCARSAPHLAGPMPANVASGTENPYDRLADGFEQHLDMELLWKILAGEA